MDPTLAGYVKEDVVIRYDPADLAEIRVFHQDRFVCRAICQELAGSTVSLKEIEKAAERRKQVQAGLSPALLWSISLSTCITNNRLLQRRWWLNPRQSKRVHGSRGTSMTDHNERSLDLCRHERLSSLRRTLRCLSAFSFDRSGIWASRHGKNRVRQILCAMGSCRTIFA